MPTTAEIKSFQDAIRRAAVEGTPRNPGGLPATLANLLVAQSQHESGNYSSNIFRTGNNAFGYSFVSGSPWQLPAPGIVSTNGAATAQYKSVGDSAREIVDWIFRRVREGKFPQNLDTISTPEQYATLLKSASYYEDTVANYTAGLKRYFIPVALGAGGLLLAGLIVYFFYKKTK